MKYILAIDQGTTSSRALIFNKFGKVEFKSQMEIECLFPKEGWVEQNALDVWVSVINVINDALAKMNITVDDIYAIGITNQRETTVTIEGNGVISIGDKTVAKKPNKPFRNTFKASQDFVANSLRAVLKDHFEKTYEDVFDGCTALLKKLT